MRSCLVLEEGTAALVSSPIHISCFGRGCSGRSWCLNSPAASPLRCCDSPFGSGPDPGHRDEWPDPKTSHRKVKPIHLSAMVALAWRIQPCSGFIPMPSGWSNGFVVGSATLLGIGPVLPMAALASQCSIANCRLRFAVRCHSTYCRWLGSSAMAITGLGCIVGRHADRFGRIHFAPWSESTSRDRLSSTCGLFARSHPFGPHMETTDNTRIDSHDRSRFIRSGALSWLVQLLLLHFPHPPRGMKWCPLARGSNYQLGLKLPNQD